MGMMSALVCYVIPGLIGRAYDLKNETVGPDLFHVNDSQDIRVIEKYATTSEYRLISDLSDASDFLDVGGKLALNLKSGSKNLEGKGSYLKELGSFKNRVDLLVKVHYETVTETLPSTVKPLSNWQEMLVGTGNTHYIRSIQYGGELIAALSFIATNEGDKEAIQGMIQGELNSKSGSGLQFMGNLEKILKNTRDMASININYFATVPLENIPRTIESLTTLVEMFPNQTKQVNNGLGVPLQMEVFSLEGLGRDMNAYYQTTAFTNILSILDEQFTDFRSARRLLQDWMKTLPPFLSEEMKAEIGGFSNKLDELDKVFSEVIANMDLSSNASPEQFEPAFKAYQDNNTEELYPDYYVNRFSKLKRDVLMNTPAFEADFGGAILTHWGADECSNTSLVLQGEMAATNKMSIGSSKFVCLPSKPDFQNPPNPGDEEIEDMPHMQPLVFIPRGNNNRDRSGYRVKCASCRIPGKTSVTMLSGHKDCPLGWTLQYGGVLVSTDYRSGRGELICLDNQQEMSKWTGEISGNSIVTEVSPSCQEFPCSGGVNENKAIACVVCSAKKESKSQAEVYVF